MQRHRFVRSTAMVTGATLVALGLLGAQVVSAPASVAAEQNDYVFNDPWVLQTPGSATSQYTPTAYRTQATGRATSVLPTSTGPVAIDARFTPLAGRTPGASFLAAGTNQSSYGAQPATFVGAPTPAALPALGILTNGSEGCGGPLGSAAHQNFNGVCSIGTLTVTFSRPMTDVVLDISGLGGWSAAGVGAYQRGSFNSTIWTITSAGASFAQPSSGATNLSITDKVMQVRNRNTNARCDTNAVDQPAGARTRSPNKDFAGCGSVRLSGTYTAVTFDLTSEVTPYSAFPAATFGTGAAYFANDGTTSADGVNGRNVVFTETLRVPGNPGDSDNSDLQRVSFRLPEQGSLGDRVWNDANGNGVQDAGEPGVGGVAATLTDAAGAPVTDTAGNPITTVTAADGSYLFPGLPFGDYRVRFTGLPARFSFTRPNVGADDADSDADPATGLSSVARIDTAAPANLTVDAGIGEYGSIGDTVWLDNDRDGGQDVDEPGVAGVTVVLYGPGGTEITRTATDPQGTYLFPFLPLGVYSVGFEGFPTGATLTAPRAGSDDTVDSDADPTSGRTGALTLTSQNRNLTNVDAGLLSPLGSIGDTVWRDGDRDGVQDAGEPGVPGVTVILRDGAGAETARTTTDAAGKYRFGNQPMGDHIVEFTGLPAGLTFTPRAVGGDRAVDSDADAATGRTGTVTLTPAVPDVTDVDAGLVTPLGSIGDTVWRDDDRDGIQDAGEPGVAGVTVVLRDGAGDEVARKTTDAGGKYSFTGLPMGDYSVEFTNLPTGSTFAPRAAGGDRAVDSDADPATGRTGTITLPPTAPDVTDVDAGLLTPRGSIGDTVWRDANRDGAQGAGEPGVPGVTVVLYDGAGTEVARTTTDASGNYLFDALPLGGYTVGFEGVPDGLQFTGPKLSGDPSTDSDADPATGRTGTITLTPAVPDVTNVDAGLVSPPRGSIGDTVWRDENRDGAQDAGEPGVAGVTVVLRDGAGAEVARTTTDADGHYLFDDLPLGGYTVGFEGLPVGLSFTGIARSGDPSTDSDADPTTGRTGTISPTPAVPDVTDVDAGLVAPPPPGSIGDRVWSDDDRDGVQDPTEPGVPGVTVVLRNGDGAEVDRTATDDHGNYLFEGLPEGDYTVGFEGLPDGAVLTTPGVGDDRALDSDPAPDTGRTPPVSLTDEAPGETGVDAGLLPLLGSIGSRVWDDRDRDGRQDADEPGVPGVTVVLYEAGGGPGEEIERVSTDPSGAYLFPDLPLGDYDVGFLDLPAGFEFTFRGVGGSETDSDVDPATGLVRVALTPGAPDQLSIGAGVRVSAASPGAPGAPGSPGSPERPAERGSTGALSSTGADGAWIAAAATLGALLLGGGILLIRRRRSA
ncbi:SdrD B-like domain-containing protein [Microbacterium sp. EST19A]|uniref:SdrD B-like domain-containing protein n=1 Tax=Microbacterium sp. EST19A TaxID=2862681 RepID=UPI001CBB4DA6|nr:SdrD B-like domain-containing protein [Microbacterium sp. EST19A]